MTTGNTAGVSALGGLVLAVVTVWFLWDLFFAGVDLLALSTGASWPVAAFGLLASLLYATYRYRRNRERGY